LREDNHIKQHKRGTCEGKNPPCRECDHQATSKKHLTQHQKIVHRVKKYSGGECKHKGTSKGNLAQQQKASHRRKICAPFKECGPHKGMNEASDKETLPMKTKKNAKESRIDKKAKKEQPKSDRASKKGFKENFLTIKFKLSDIQSRAGTVPDFALFIKDDVHSPDATNAAAYAGKYLTYIKGDITNKFFSHSGISFNQDEFFLCKNQIDFTEASMEVTLAEGTPHRPSSKGVDDGFDPNLITDNSDKEELVENDDETIETNTEESNVEYYDEDLDLFQDQEMLAELNDEGTTEETTDGIESNEAMFDDNNVSIDEDKSTSGEAHESENDFLDNEEEEQQGKNPYTLNEKVKDIISGVTAGQTGMADDLDEVMIKQTGLLVLRLLSRELSGLGNNKM